VRALSDNVRAQAPLLSAAKQWRYACCGTKAELATARDAVTIC
jgi:hypothetical protein